MPPPIVTSRAGFMAFNLRHLKEKGVQPSSVINGETQNYSTSISRHPEVGGMNHPQVASLSPLSQCLDLQLGVSKHSDAHWLRATYTVSQSMSTVGRGSKFRLKTAFFLFFFFPTCLFVPQFTSFTVCYKALFAHGPKFPPRQSYQPSLKL